MPLRGPAAGFERPVVLLASSRSNGNTSSLVELVLPSSCASLFDLSALNIAPFSYTHENANDDFLPLVEQLLHFPVWVIATPLYWYTMSAQAKTFMDRLSDLLSFRKELGRRLRGKSMAVLCSGTDPELPKGFDEPFLLTSEYLGMNFLGSLYCQFVEREPTTVGIAQTSSAFRALLLQGAVSHATPNP